MVKWGKKDHDLNIALDKNNMWSADKVKYIYLGRVSFLCLAMERFILFQQLREKVGI